MSRGPWKPKDTPPDNTPASPLLRLALLFEEDAAHHSGLAATKGQIAAELRTIDTLTKREHKKHAASALERRAA